ncbi:OST-HTH/LOTUS domain-containing protein [Paraglaciecola sp. MB-3u-78]|uniref:OST-HTH/LOTUS domain-containing protein n=1 Tax=Paraglaciecola sp. MB-3u-78 TaxID=2058332 RepID=UPI00350F89C5
MTRLVSSDCNFTPLVTRALADGKFVIGFGQQKTHFVFVNSYSRFLFLDDEPKDVVKPEPPKKNIKSDTRLMNLLRQTVEAVEDDNGWARLGPIGTHISNHTSFDQRNYEFIKLSDLFTAIDLFEMKKTNDLAIWVRDKKQSK